MHVIAPATEAEVVAAFLRAEIASPRFGPLIRARLAEDGRAPSTIETPDTSSDADNAYRAALLRDYRGAGGVAPLLEGLPERIDWVRARLAASELPELRYADYPFWNELSGGTRSPLRAIERMREGGARLGRLEGAFEAVAERLCAGEDLGPLILVALDDASPLVILEGHTRVTGMLLRPECVSDGVEVLIGRAPGVVDWIHYGRPERAA
jgi:hypothetical protein